MQEPCEAYPRLGEGISTVGPVFTIVCVSRFWAVQCEQLVLSDSCKVASMPTAWFLPPFFAMYKARCALRRTSW